MNTCIMHYFEQRTGTHAHTNAVLLYTYTHEHMCIILLCTTMQLDLHVMEPIRLPRPPPPPRMAPFPPHTHTHRAMSWNGAFPLMASYSMHPRLYTLHFSLTLLLLNSSGAMYCGVPPACWLKLMKDLKGSFTREMPKSAILAWPWEEEGGSGGVSEPEVWPAHA